MTNKDEYEKNLIKNVLSSIMQYGGERYLSSIVLTGSFGRGEPTYILNDNEEIRLKSDVEIALIYPRNIRKKKVIKLIEAVSNEFVEELNLMPISEKRIRKAYNFNYTIKEPKFKTIFTYDLYNGSYPIWGRNFLSEKNIVLSDIDPYEAKRLVANRIAELTYLWGSEEIIREDYLRKQWKGKLVLAIASAWLICEKEYVSSYNGQYYKIKKNQTKVNKWLDSDFFEDYKKIFQFLRESGEEYEVSDEKLRAYVQHIDQYIKECQVSKPKVNSFSRMTKYLAKYLRTGMKYGIVGFEDNILQALINEYYMQKNRLNATANVWHCVLY